MEDSGSTTNEPMTSSSGEPPDDTGSTSTPPGTDTGDSGSGSGGGAACDADPSVEIGTNHGHELLVPLADVESGAQQVYDIQGTSGHSHLVTLMPGDFAALQAGMNVMVDSTTDSGHSHTVMLTCI